MDPARFDYMSKLFATRRRTRRQAFQMFGAAGLAGGMLTFRREPAAADCPDISTCLIPCGMMCANSRRSMPGGSVGACWDWTTLSCNPCHTTWDDLNARCNQGYPTECQGLCAAW